jgi:hypothetical protein
LGGWRYSPTNLPGPFVPCAFSLLFHPHLHANVADGLFRPNGTFYCLPERDLKELEDIFRSKILDMLKGEGKINDELIEKLTNWRHIGLSVHPRTPSPEKTEEKSRHRSPLHGEHAFTGGSGEMVI